jgi:hypothetical protein
MKVCIVVVKSLEKSAFRKHLIHISSSGADMPCIELYAKRLERKATHIVFLHAAYYIINPQPGNEGAKSIYCFLGRDGDIPSLFGMGTWADVYGCSTLPPPCLGRSPPSLITK